MVKEVIGQIVYDTKKAAEVASHANHYVTLYLTRNGAWFLAWRGGPIRPLGSEGAFKWPCDHQQTDAANYYFPGRLKEA